jgi:hypothetical protein
VDSSGVGIVHSGHEAQQRRLAGTVGADETDLLPAGDGGSDRFEDDLGADLATDALQANDCHLQATVEARLTPGINRFARSWPLASEGRD